MNIRARLTLMFFGIVIIVLTVISVSIYVLSATYRETDFYRRLRNRAINAARVLAEMKEVNASLLRRMELNNPASLTNQYILIRDANDSTLYTSHGNPPVVISEAVITQVRAGKEVKFATDEYEVLGFTFEDEGQSFTVVAAATDKYGWDALVNLRNILIIIFACSIVIISFLGWIYSGRVLQPITRIVGDVGKINSMTLNERLDEGNRRDELGQLASTFNRMLDRLKGAFDAQKTFIANASHEIKTPITVLSTEVEVALMQKRNAEQYESVLRSVLGRLKNLNRLSTQLLLLAQTTAESPDRHFMQLRIDDLLWEIKEELFRIHPEYIIDILFSPSLRHESLVVNGDEQLLKVAFLNLAENACKYSDDNRVIINLHSPTPSKLLVEFVNGGRGISPENQQRIFDPFYRVSDDKKVKGFGIGLSLVRSITLLHAGEISVESQPHAQTKFTLALPLHTV